MNVGTKSVLFGVHAFWWHPFTVALAWRKLYGRWPSIAEWICIFCHDVGYWGCPNMDGKEGRQHPLAGAKVAAKIVKYLSILVLIIRHPRLCLFDWQARGRRNSIANRVAIETRMMTLYHSREYARLHKAPPSPLCWADKFCCFYDPAWFYLLRAHLSGEIYEFRANAAGHVPDSFSFSDWFRWYRLKILWLPEIQSLLASRRRSCIFPL